MNEEMRMKRYLVFKKELSAKGLTLLGIFDFYTQALSWHRHHCSQDYCVKTNHMTLSSCKPRSQRNTKLRTSNNMCI